MKNMKTTEKFGGIALIIAALFTLTRMIPVVLSEGFNSNSLPPGQNAAQTAETALLGGWYFSHIMAMLTVPFFVYGFLAVYQSVRAQNEETVAEQVTLAGFFFITLAGFLYLSGAVLDGIALGRVSEHYVASSEAEREFSGLIVMAVTESAASFGAHYMLFAMIGTGILALGLYLAGRGSIQPILGMLIGVFAIIGWVTGFLDTTFQERLPALLGSLAATMIWWISLGILTIRISKTNQNAE